MPLDLTRLHRDIETRRAARPVDIGPGGRRLTGAMDAVRTHLADIEALRAGGASWVDIAAALAAQGVTQGDGVPITGRRLTSLIDSVRKQKASKAASQAGRGSRSDLHPRPAADVEPASPQRVTLTLSPDLVAPSPLPMRVDRDDAEEALRRENLSRVQAFLKPEPDRTKAETDR